MKYPLFPTPPLTRAERRKGDRQAVLLFVLFFSLLCAAKALLPF